jgi:hypothetical protein
MPLAVINIPDEVSYSKEPILLSLKASNVFTDALEGLVMKLSIAFQGGIVAGKKIEFVINGQKMTFTCVDNYTQTDMANTFPSQGALTFQEWYVLFLGAILTNYSANHKIKFSGLNLGAQQLTFATIEPTTDFSIITDIVDATVTIEEVGIIPYAPVYEIVAELEVNTEGVNDSRVITELSVVPETSDPYKSDFYLEKFLDEVLIIEPPRLTVPHQDKNRYKRFFIRYTERYGEPLWARLLRVADVKWVLKGGFDWLFKQQVNANIVDYLGSFLTSQPSEKQIGKNQPEYLYFFNNTQTRTVKLYVRVSWTGGSVTTHPLSDIALEPKEMHVLPVAWQHLGIQHPNFPEKEPIWYEVSLAVYSFLGFNNHFTNVQKYIIADQCDARYLIFQNKRGGMDTIRVLDNKSQHIISTKKDTFLRVWHRDTFAQTVNYNRKSSSSFKVQTGVIDRPHATWLAELFESDYIWEIDKVSGIYIPIIITTDKVTIIDGEDDLYDIQFEFQYAIEK